MTNQQLDHFRSILEKQRNDINRQINDEEERAKENTASASDVAEISAQMIDTDTALSIGQNLTNQYNAIEEALARIDRGTYGKCQECGKDISIKRLEALPTATTCTEDAARAEEEMEEPATL
ncbi:MAG TPA: TraR/DksA family transcriptional regulator [Blastocatellia bacterium]|nr:TraR/DksA family transcriptional regulator [Blastocatellia bacterium]